MDKFSIDEKKIFKEHIYKQYNIHNYTNVLDININKNSNYINKFNDFINLMDIQIDKLNTSSIVFKIIRNNNILNYAYLYINNGKFKYINISSNLVSKYSEVRKRLIDIQKIKLLETKYKDLFNYFYIYLLSKININFQLTYIYFINNEKDKIDINDELLLRTYIILYIIEQYYIYNNNQDFNINDITNNTLFDSYDYKLFEEYYIKNKIIINNFINDFSSIFDNINLIQKITPLSFLEFKETYNTIHPQWKELFIHNKINYFLYNSISNNFPLFINWFIIPNSNKLLYDNENIFDNLLYNEQIFNILEKIKNNKNFNKELKETYNKLKENKNIIDKHLQNDNIIYNLLYSNYSICYIYEYVGYTLYQYLEKNNIFNDYDKICKFLFEIIYSLYCLNLKGIIHKDLHLNNITVNDTIDNNYNIYNLNSNIHNNSINFINDKKINDKFDISNNKNIFVFKNNKLNTNIIDFNQSILYRNYKDNKNIEYLNILCIVKNIFNKEKINEEYIFNQLENNYDNLFMKLSAYDMYKLSNCLLLFVKNKKIDFKIRELLENIKLDCYNHLDDIISNKVIVSKNNKFIISKNDKYFPNYLLLTKYFKKYNYNQKKDITNIYDNIFTLDNIKHNYLIDTYNLNINKLNLCNINKKIYNHNNDANTELKKMHLISNNYFNNHIDDFNLINNILNDVDFKFI